MTIQPKKHKQGWRAALLARLTPQRPSRSRRRMLLLDSLEDRLAPAVAGSFYVAGTTLVYNGNFADNDVTVSGTDAALTVHDAEGAIVSSVPGFSGGGTSTVTGAVPSYIQTIAINGQNGTDVVNLAGLHTSRNVIATGTVVNNTAALIAKNVTETGTLVTLGANITTNGAGPVAGSVLLNGTISVTANATITTSSVIDGNITLNGPVSGSHSLTLDGGTGGNVSAAQTVNLGGGSALRVTDAANVGLHGVTDTANTAIFAQKAVNLNGSLNTTGTVTVFANQGAAGSYGFTQVTGNITTTAGNVTIEVFGTGGATVNGITTGTGGTVTIVAGGAIADGNGAGVVNVTTGTGGTVNLAAGVGGINLDTSTSNLDASVSSGNLAGDINVRNTGLALATAAGGVATSAGNVNLSNDRGLTVTNGDGVFAGLSHSVTLTTTNPASASGSLTLDGSVGLTGDTVNLDTTGDIVGSATGVVTATKLNVNAGSGTTGISGIIGSGAPVLVTSGTSSPVTVNATTTIGAIDIESPTGAGSPITVTNATTSAGAITLTTSGANNNLVIAGFVANNDASTIALQSDQDLTIQSGSVTSAGGRITLAPGNSASSATGSLIVHAGTTVATAGTITVFATNAATAVIDIDGTFSSTAAVAIDGGSGAVNLVLEISGTITSFGAITIDNSADTTTSTIIIGGTIAGSEVDVNVSTAGDNLTVAPSTTTPFVFTFQNGSVSTLDIDTALGNITGATAGFTSPITFTAVSGFQAWTNSGAGTGTVTVTPTVP